LPSNGSPPEIWRVLLAKFSTGVRLPELRSIAAILCVVADLPAPSRDANRSCVGMVQWFCADWGAVTPWLAWVELLDKDERVIDGNREMNDMGISTQ
jgi:hypothetical protein